MSLVDDLEKANKYYRDQVTSLEIENDRLQRVVNAARKYRTGQNLPSHCVSLSQVSSLGDALDEALRNLDRNKETVRCRVCQCITEELGSGNDICSDCD